MGSSTGVLFFDICFRTFVEIAFFFLTETGEEFPRQGEETAFLFLDTYLFFLTALIRLRVVALGVELVFFDEGAITDLHTKMKIIIHYKISHHAYDREYHIT